MIFKKKTTLNFDRIRKIMCKWRKDSDLKPKDIMKYNVFMAGDRIIATILTDKPKALIGKNSVNLNLYEAYLKSEKITEVNVVDINCFTEILHHIEN